MGLKKFMRAKGSGFRFFTVETTPSGRKLHYRLFGVKVFSRAVKRAPKVVALPADRRRLLLIRRNDMGAGLMSHWATALGWIAWAREHDLVPYVDMKTIPNLFNRKTVDAVNYWERFFAQPDGLDIRDMASARKVMETEQYAYPEAYPVATPEWMSEGSDELGRWRKVWRENSRLSDGMAALVDERHRVLFGEESKVLGCLVRGTDYLKMKPAGHQVQPDPEMVVRDARRACDEFGIRRVFLATEDAGIQELFRREFGSALIVNQTALPQYSDGFLVRSGAMGDGMESLRISQEYLVSVVLLSRCRYLLAGCTSGSVAAMVMSSGYEWSKIYSLGKYPGEGGF